MKFLLPSPFLTFPSPISISSEKPISSVIQFFPLFDVLCRPTHLMTIPNSDEGEDGRNRILLVLYDPKEKEGIELGL